MIGYVYSGLSQQGNAIHRHVWGWPLIHSACWLDPYGLHTFVEHYFSYYWLCFDFFISLALVLFSIILVRYITSRPMNYKHYSIKELLISMTAVAFIMPYAMKEYEIYRMALPEFPFDTHSILK